MLAAQQIDPLGIYGLVLHHALIVFLVGSAFMLFLYFWYQGRLDMDDEPAIRMMQMSDERPEQESGHGPSENHPQ